MAGVVTAELLLERLTATPPAGAAAARVTVHASDPAPVMDEAEQDRLASVGAVAAFSCRWASAVPPLEAAVMVTATEEVTAAIFAMNVALLAFFATVTEAGTETEALLDVRATRTLVAELPLRLTVQLICPAPLMEEGEQAKLLGTNGPKRPRRRFSEF